MPVEGIFIIGGRKDRISIFLVKLNSKLSFEKWHTHTYIYAKI
jgi:hypothetical protein